MKDNKLIAEFMDLRSTGMSIYKESEYEYHTSWDWLMPVVIKIGQGGNIIKAMKDLRKYSSVRTIEDTYQAVVEFIKTYNNEN